MKIKMNEASLEIRGELVGNQIKIGDTKELARGLTYCRNHKFGMELIKNISNYHIDTDITYVEYNSIEMELYKQIQVSIKEYEKKKFFEDENKEEKG